MNNTNNMYFAASRLRRFIARKLPLTSVIPFTNDICAAVAPLSSCSKKLKLSNCVDAINDFLSVSVYKL